MGKWALKVKFEVDFGFFVPVLALFLILSWVMLWLFGFMLEVPGNLIVKRAFRREMSWKALRKLKQRSRR